MITCGKCGKDNQDHYKFCLGCGAELSRDAAPKPFSPQTPPHGVESMGQPAPMATTPPAEPAAAAPVAVPAVAGASGCPKCGHHNASSSRFCAGCGHNLDAPAAPGASASPPEGSIVPRPAEASGGSAAGPVGVSLTALRADGTEAGTYALSDAPRVMVGRDSGSVFAGDSYLSPKHASFIRQDGRLLVRDEGSLNGVYLKIHPEVPWALEFGDIFRIGQEIIRLEALEAQPNGSDDVERLGSPRAGYVARLALVIGRDTTGNAFPVPESGAHCGRERGDVLFSEDGYVSGLHCSIAPGPDGKLYLTDVGSSNGTFVRLSKEHPVTAGDTLLMGQQLFRVDMQ